MSPKKLVIGASGFLGSHVAKELVQRGEDVRVLIRTTSSTRGIEGLDVERHYGDIFDDDALRAAMHGCDVVFYCVVDARSWLRDPSPLFRTNVEGLRHVLDAAVDARLERFVFTSSIATIGLSSHTPATEQVPNNWLTTGGAYVRSRVEAENLVLQYSRARGLPAVAMCVSNTYGPGDWLPTPHGSLVSAAAKGRMPVYFKGAASEVVGIDDAARALVLAADRGRPGERYIVSERMMSSRDICHTAADAVGARPPRWGIPLSLMYVIGFAGQLAARVLRRDLELTVSSVRLLHIMSPMDHSKAVNDLGWRPAPAPEAIGDAARFFRSKRRST